MPTYLYREILEDGTEGEVFEIVQSMRDPPLASHPATGRPVKRVYAPPRLSTRYSAGATRQRLETKNLERHGFTKYVRDRATGTYHKEAGREGPSSFKPA